MRQDYQNSVIENFSVSNTQGVQINVNKPEDRLTENYTCKDQNWQTGAFNGDIYISMPEETHNLIVNHNSLPESGYPGTSGFFTDETTASKHFFGNNEFDSVGLAHDLQQAPHFDNNAFLKAQENGQIYYPEYNPHLDCFRVNEQKMFENYGTTDFYAAQSKCMENTAWGEGGGQQGYNPFINEMINNGSLEYIPEKSRFCGSNKCFDYSTRKEQTSKEASTVNEYIKDNNIQGNPGERLAYNELPVSLAQSPHNSPPPPPSSGPKEPGEISRNADEISQKLAEKTNSADIVQNKTSAMTGGMV